MQPTARRALYLYSALVVLLTALAWGIALSHASTPLFDPEDRFSDLTDYADKIANLSAGGPALADDLPIFTYPAPALFVYVFFLRIFPNPVAAFLIFTGVAATLAFGVLLRPRLPFVAIAATLVCSYPLYFLADRGNIEIVVALFVITGVVCFFRRDYWWACFAFALAASIKPFPLLYFYLFQTRRLYRQTAAGLAIVGLVNLASLAWLGPSIRIAYASLQVGANAFLNDYVRNYRSDEIRFDHSLFSVVKRFIPHPAQIQVAYPYYVGFAIAAIALGAWWFRRLPLLNQLFFVVLTLLLIPPVSYDYTLVYVHILWGALSLRTTPRFRELILFALLTTPQSYLFGYGGQFKALVLVYLFWFAAHTIDIGQIGEPTQTVGAPHPELASRVQTSGA